MQDLEQYVKYIEEIVGANLLKADTESALFRKATNSMNNVYEAKEYVAETSFIEEFGKEYAKANTLFFNVLDSFYALTKEGILSTSQSSFGAAINIDRSYFPIVTFKSKTGTMPNIEQHYIYTSKQFKKGKIEPDSFIFNQPDKMDRGVASQLFRRLFTTTVKVAGETSSLPTTRGVTTDTIKHLTLLMRNFQELHINAD